MLKFRAAQFIDRENRFNSKRSLQKKCIKHLPCRTSPGRLKSCSMLAAKRFKACHLSYALPASSQTLKIT